MSRVSPGPSSLGQSAQGRPQPGLQRAMGQRGWGPRAEGASRVPRGLGRCSVNGDDRGRKMWCGRLPRPMSPLEGPGLHQAREAPPGPAKTPRPPRSSSARPHLGARQRGLYGGRADQAGPRFPTVEGLGGGSTPEKIRVPHSPDLVLLHGPSLHLSRLLP